MDERKAIEQALTDEDKITLDHIIDGILTFEDNGHTLNLKMKLTAAYLFLDAMKEITDYNRSDEWLNKRIKNWGDK